MKRVRGMIVIIGFIISLFINIFTFSGLSGIPNNDCFFSVSDRLVIQKSQIRIHPITTIQDIFMPVRCRIPSYCNPCAVKNQLFIDENPSSKKSRYLSSHLYEQPVTQIII